MIAIMTVHQMIHMIQIVQLILIVAITPQNFQNFQPMMKNIINQKDKDFTDSLIHSVYNFLINLLYRSFFF